MQFLSAVAVPLNSFLIFCLAGKIEAICHFYLENTTGLRDEVHKTLQTRKKNLIIHQSHRCCIILMAQLPHDHKGKDIKYIISETSAWALTTGYGSSDGNLAACSPNQFPTCVDFNLTD